MTSVRFIGVCSVLLVVTGCARDWPECGVARFDWESHRGGRAQRPENTIPAFEYALSKGIRTLEMDLAVTKDDVLVLSHDPTLFPERCNGPDRTPAQNVAIRSLTLQELKGYDCGASPHAEFPNQVQVPGTSPPTLLQVLALAERMSGGSARYNIEIKTDPAWDDTLTPSIPLFVDLVESDIAAAGIGERVLIQSFDPRPLRLMFERGSKLRRSILFPSTNVPVNVDWVTALDHGSSVGAAVFSPYAMLVTRAMVARAHADGMAVIPWTPNTRDELENLIELGVDGIISDDIDLMLDVAANGPAPRGGVCF